MKALASLLFAVVVMLLLSALFGAVERINSYYDVTQPEIVNLDAQGDNPDTPDLAPPMPDPAVMEAAINAQVAQAQAEVDQRLANYNANVTWGLLGVFLFIASPLLVAMYMMINHQRRVMMQRRDDLHRQLEQANQAQSRPPQAQNASQPDTSRIGPALRNPTTPPLGKRRRG